MELNFGDDVRVTDMSGYCRNRHQWLPVCDGALRDGFTGYHWYCTCPCHPEPPKTGPNPGFPEAYEQWAKARTQLDGGQP